MLVIEQGSLRNAVASACRAALTVGVMTMMLSACGGGGGGGDSAGGTSNIPTGGSGGTGGGTGGGDTGGGGTGGGTGGTTPTSNAKPVVYMADQDTYQIDELYMTIPGSPGSAVKLNAPLVQGGWVDDFRIMPAGNAVVYTADQNTLGRYELFIVNMQNPGASTKLNQALGANRDVLDFTISPDGTKIAYRADVNADNVYELYMVNVASPGNAVKLNGTLAMNGYVRDGYEFSPDSTQVLYRADQNATEVVELYVVNVATPGQTNKVNSTLVAGGDVTTDFHFSPDGTKIAYVADQAVDGQLELYVVSTNALGQSTKLNGQLVAEGDVCRYEWAPNSQRVAYCADQLTDGVIELFTVTLATPGQSVKLNPPLVAGGEVSASYAFSADSSYVVYGAEQEVADRNELYRVDMATPGVATKLNDSLVSGGDVGLFDLRPDGSKIAYLASQDNAQVWEIYEVEMAVPAVSTKVSAPMNAGGAFWFEYTEDFSHMVYLADQDSDAAELYDVALAQPRTSSKLNSALVANGEVWEYEVIK